VTMGPRPSLAWAAGTLRLCEMPPEEVRAVLTADDPEIVHRFLELHRERLEEEVAERGRTLATLERYLTEEILERDRCVI
jgi:CRP-like cAMP-binding protein